MRKLTDLLLSNFRWYRRWRGGFWYRERADFGQGPMFGWFTGPEGPDTHCRKVVATEDYGQVYVTASRPVDRLTGQ